MKAIRLHVYGLDQVRYEEVAVPQVGPGQALVRVRAATVNPIDVKKASGTMKREFPLQFPWTPGADFAGTVAAVGEGVTLVQPDSDVFGYTPADGSFAEYLVVPAAVVALKPAALSFTEAAAVPVAALTAWQGLTRGGHLQAGQTVLIHGAAGSVGAYAVQFAHQLGAKVIATAAPENLDFVRSLGADEVIDYQATRFETVGRSVDVVLDLIGGDTQHRSYAVLKPGGYLMATSQPPAPDEATTHGVHALMLNMQPSGTDLSYAQLLEAGTLKVDVARTYPLAEVAQAWADSTRHLHPLSAASAPAAAEASPIAHGKIVLEVV